jgi:hypothetical protein
MGHIMKNSATSPEIRNILNQISSIQSMERGKLTSFYRTRPALQGGGTVRLGPYYKLQAWENKHNCTRHIPAAEVDELKQDLDNHKEFKKLVATLEQSIIDKTRARRGGDSVSLQESKKNSTTKRSLKNTAKPKRSSSKPKRC